MNWFKRGLKHYDDWCKEMGLTPDQKRSCVPYRKDPAHQNEENSEALLFSDSQFIGTDKKSQDEAL
ncbi:DUF5363 domain-containing protein [Vibrio antiquarius]|uniref:DUF5363 domain-containing protein n=1 Tax=Vibrio antiquarius (strain Ex25) TaxID=150340 RepID=UPI002658777E|nr:DUF5363 domain-containing protein [Vibrio antiquarius]MCR9933680.1 DUF5363 domain-containing protein [Vibrio antiquarius]